MSQSVNPRAIAFAALAGLAGCSALAYAAATPAFDAPSAWRVVFFLALGTFGLALPFCWPAVRGRREIWLLLGLAALVRAAIFPAAPSDDIHRYLWEGRLVAEGVSPYAAPADDPALAAFRDGQWERMNNRDKWTAYPPGALLAFAMMAKICYEPWFFKLVFVLLDLALAALLIDLARRRSLAVRWVGLYAFNPVALAAFAGEGHFDILMALPLAGAVALSARRRFGLAAFCLGLAVAAKVMAVLALPFFLKRAGWRWVGVAAAAGLLLSLPFAGDLPQLVRGVIAFGSERSFNGPVYDVFHELLGSRRTASLLMGGVLLGLLGWRYFFRPGASWEADWVFACGALLVLAPTFHFWYLTWLIPFVALRPSLAWMAFCVTQAFYFLVWRNWEAANVWDLEPWQTYLIWGPFLLLGVYELIYFHRKKPGAGAAPPEGLSVVIPALNAAEHLPACLQSITASTAPADEVIVVDGGSSDDTLAVAQGAGCRTESSEPGRGQQIGAGVRAARFRYLLILHADCRLPPMGLERVRAVLAGSPDVSGGALGQRFDRSAPVLLFIEAMNEFRATFGGIPFGDQAQFFNRARLPGEQFPAQPLMEDVELGLRLRARGRVVYLGEEVVSSSAKWQKVGSWARISLVFRFVVAYRWARLWSRERAAQLSEALYREYYGE